MSEDEKKKAAVGNADQIIGFDKKFEEAIKETLAGIPYDLEKDDEERDDKTIAYELMERYRDFFVCDFG